MFELFIHILGFIALFLLFISIAFWEEIRAKSCWLFGHKIPKGWQGGLPYFRTVYQTTDGINTDHYFLTCKCEHCDKEMTVGKIHGPLTRR